MLTYRERSFEDYLEVLRRRKWLILIPAALGPLVGYVITLFLTPRYTSTSLILIEQPTVPTNIVPSDAQNSLFARLAAMEEQILSRTKLQPLIERYDLYKSQRKRSMEDALDEMRKAIVVNPVIFAGDAIGRASGPGKQQVPGFSVAFTGDGSRLSQQVATDLTNMFIDENLRQQEQRAQGTNEFLTAQLAEAKRKLDEQGAKLAEFKRQNLGALPDEQQTNLQLLGTLNGQLTAVTDVLDRAQQDKASVQALLDEQMEQWQASQPGGSNDLDTLKSQLAKMQDALTVLEGRYTSDYPDVIKLKSDIRQMKERLAEEEAAHKDQKPNTLASPLAPPAIQQLRAQLRQDEDVIKSKTNEQERLNKRIKALESQIQMSPLVEQQFKELTLGHDTALKFYNDLLANSNASQMAADLQSRQQGEQFRILDPPDLPTSPSFPVWWQFALGGLGGGLALGLGFVMIAEFRDKSIRDERDIEFYLQLPTLAMVPTIGAGNGKNGHKEPLSGTPGGSRAASTLKF